MQMNAVYIIFMYNSITSLTALARKPTSRHSFDHSSGPKSRIISGYKWKSMHIPTTQQQQQKQQHRKTATIKRTS